MKTILPVSKLFFSALLLLVFYSNGYTQNSSKTLLINHGGTSCGNNAPQQHFFAGTLTANPTLIASCNVGIPYNNVFAAYNPADHKVYFAEKAGSTTKVYALDFNLSGVISCPAPTTPTYTYSYMLDQLCFDNEGNNYVTYNFNAGAATASLAQVDITTGIQKPGSEKIIRFPANNIPNSVAWGDIVILPNGRMFMTFGNSPSKLFELTNVYGPGDATAVFLTNIPRQCFSIGYVDGNLTIAGSDGGGCYYYIWDINSAALSSASTFPLGKNSSDMSNMTVGVGTANELMGAVTIDATTSTLYYDIVMKNKGNITLNNVQLTDDLASTFGAGNFSDVQASFVHNPGNLSLNSNYDGVTDLTLLESGQALENSPISNDSVVIRITLTAKNLVPGHVYYNSAIGSGQIGAGANYLAVSDSSNVGRSNQIDIDGNGVSDDLGENIPTPFAFGTILTNSTISLKGNKENNIITLNWNALQNTEAGNYLLQRSYNGKDFVTIAGFTKGKDAFRFTDKANASSNAVYYQVKTGMADNKFTYSNIISFKTLPSKMEATAWPNPFNTAVTIRFAATVKTTGVLTIADAMGRPVMKKAIATEIGSNLFTIDLSKLAPGIYLCEVLVNNEKQVLKLVKR